MDSIAPIDEFQQANAAASRFRGVCARVAKKLGLSHEHVRQVALGHRTSARVAKALSSEIRRVERERAA